MAIQGISNPMGTRPVVDPRDLNRDGKVTPAEIAAYHRAHPLAPAVPAKASSETSGRLGPNRTQGSGIGIDLYA